MKGIERTDRAYGRSGFGKGKRRKIKRLFPFSRQ